MSSIKHRQPPNPKLPSIDSFAFSNILREIDNETKDALNAIAAICARSKLSLANEHSSHRPPLGEIKSTDGNTAPARRLSTVSEGSASEKSLLLHLNADTACPFHFGTADTTTESQSSTAVGLIKIQGSSLTSPTAVAALTKLVQEDGGIRASFAQVGSRHIH